MMEVSKELTVAAGVREAQGPFKLEVRVKPMDRGQSSGLWMLLHGKKATVQFQLLTYEVAGVRRYLPADLGYHADEPQYKSHEAYEGCDCRETKQCYYDGSSLNAQPVFELLVESGEDAVWERLAEYYQERFDND